MKKATSIVALLLLSGNAALADVSTPPGVTMERCNEMDVDEIQRALRLEYWNEGDHSKTMVNVICREGRTTLRIVGPEYPYGRTTEIDLEAIAPVARPRTIAMLASELWTAPEPESQPETGPGASLRLGSVTQQSSASPRDELPEEGPKEYHRDRYSVSLVRTSMSRHSDASVNGGRFYADMSMTSIRAEAPVKPYLKVFAEYGISGKSQYNLEADQLTWTRGELGARIPLLRALWSPRVRLDLVGSIGYDTISLEDDWMQTVIPDFGYTRMGMRASWAWKNSAKIYGWSSMYRGRTHDIDTYIEGGDVGWGASIEVRDNILLSGEASFRELQGGSDYEDSQGSASIAIGYLH